MDHLGCRAPRSQKPQAWTWQSHSLQSPVTVLTSFPLTLWPPQPRSEHHSGAETHTHTCPSTHTVSSPTSITSSLLAVLFPKCSSFRFPFPVPTAVPCFNKRPSLPEHHTMRPPGWSPWLLPRPSVALHVAVSVSLLPTPGRSPAAECPSVASLQLTQGGRYVPHRLTLLTVQSCALPVLSSFSEPHRLPSWDPQDRNKTIL